MNILCTLLPIAALCGEAEIPDDLSVYAGKSPFEYVNGYRLFDVPRVDLALKLYGGDDGRDFLDGLDAATSFTLRDGALVAGLCMKDDCASANAAVAIARDGSLVALCTYAKDEDHGAKPGYVHWAGPNLNRTFLYTARDACPQEPGLFIDRYASIRR
jgi:hypothetical protein